MARIDYAVRDRIAWIRLTRPNFRNAIDDAMDAELAEALHLPLVSRVVARDDLLSCAEVTAACIATHSVHAARSAKATILELIGRLLDDGLRLEALYGYTSFGSAAELQQAPQSTGRAAAGSMASSPRP